MSMIYSHNEEIFIRLMMMKTRGKVLMRNLLFTNSFDLSFCAKRKDLNTEVTFMNNTGKYVTMALKF